MKLTHSWKWKADMVTMAIVTAGTLMPWAGTARAADLQVNANGYLTGATGVNVGGTLYGVEFVEGTCASVFGACDAAHFNFTTEFAAVLAARALLDQVFIDTFDSSTDHIYGCMGSPFCVAWTPFSILSNANVGVASAWNENGSQVDFVEVPAAGWTPTADTTNGSGVMVAVWHPGSAIPEPTTLALVGAGLLGVAAAGKRKAGRQG